MYVQPIFMLPCRAADWAYSGHGTRTAALSGKPMNSLRLAPVRPTTLPFVAIAEFYAE